MSRTVSILGLFVSIAFCFAAAGLGSMLTASSLDSWYPHLNKPFFNPPNWIFGPVWALLYLLMAVAAWRVWRKAGWSEAKPPIMLFALQLSLNVMWSLLFFGLRRPDAAFAEIMILWISILATMLMFARHDRVAVILLVPYLLWVSFAAVLNFSIWRLNV